MPIKPDTKTTAKATKSETREPWITRLKISRPRLSVPSKCAEPSAWGGRIIAVSSCLLGSWGASAGPKMPTRTNDKTITPPVNALTWSRGNRRASVPICRSVADSRVNDCIKAIDNQVDGDERSGVGKDHTGDQRIVARIERGDEQAAAARPGEDGFDDDRAAQQGAQFQSDHGNHRDQRVARDMAPDDFFLAQAFGPGGADEVLVHHFEDRRTGHAHQDTEHVDAEGEGGQKQMRQRIPQGGPVFLHDAVENIEARLFRTGDAVGAAAGSRQN